jgi:hypothetical protein
MHPKGYLGLFAVATERPLSDHQAHHHAALELRQLRHA